MDKKTTFKVKAFMDDFKSDGFSKLYEPLLDCIPFKYEDEIWEFELVIQKIRKLPSDEEFYDVEINEVKS
jgi:hypothetical protein